MFSARSEALGSAAAATQTLISQTATAVVLMIGLIKLSPQVTLSAVGLFALAAIPLRAADSRARHSGHTLGVEWQRITERLLSSARNLLLLQILGTQTSERQSARGHLHEYRRHVLVYYTVSGLKVALPQILGLILICVIATTAQKTSALMPGTLVTYFYLFLRLVQVAAGASQSGTTLAHLTPQVDEVLAWSLRQDEEIPPANADPRPVAKVGFHLRAASFHYPNTSTDVVNQVDLMLAAGQTLVISGPSGAGKSTLLSLMLGLLEPTSGTIDVIIDGETTPASLSRGRLLPALGYVGPESFLVEGSILDNVCYGLNNRPSSEQIEKALTQAECDFIQTLPKGLEHPLTEQGQGLSAGQKQRLALARALLRHPAVLILDEATSNLDTETEARIIETLTHLKGHMTLVAVSHRPALLSLADQRLSLGRETNMGMI
jgi:ABC-type bacteriocin/lantibiotic exporter with double-glycine peptidase domain